MAIDAPYERFEWADLFEEFDRDAPEEFVSDVQNHARNELAVHEYPREIEFREGTA